MKTFFFKKRIEIKLIILVIFTFTHVKKVSNIGISASPLMEFQRESLILGNNMSSGVTAPIFGKKFAKMRQREQLEV